MISATTRHLTFLALQAALAMTIAGCGGDEFGGTAQPAPGQGGGAGTGGDGGAGGTAAVGGSGGWPTAGNGGDAGQGGMAASGGQGGQGGRQLFCPDGRGPTMLLLPGGDCIDTTEVTEGQYGEWLDTTPDTTAQEAFCLWNDLFLPQCDPVEPNLPVVCVDWCDAYAYCQWAGKRLCGARGGGPLDPMDSDKLAASQWYFACSGGVGDEYPYGQTYVPDACNGADTDENAAIDVGSYPACTSPRSRFVGIFDQSGNVWEWEDACDGTTGRDDECLFRGGSYFTGSDNLNCAAFLPAPRDFQNDQYGFRCCADAQ